MTFTRHAFDSKDRLSYRPIETSHIQDSCGFSSQMGINTCTCHSKQDGKKILKWFTGKMWFLWKPILSGILWCPSMSLDNILTKIISSIPNHIALGTQLSRQFLSNFESEAVSVWYNAWGFILSVWEKSQLPLLSSITGFPISKLMFVSICIQ